MAQTLNQREIDSTHPTVDIMTTPMLRVSGRGSWSLPLTLVAATYLTSGLIIVLGGLLGKSFIAKSPLQPSWVLPATSFPSMFVVWDAQWYRRVVDQGYTYDPRTQSSVAFFPAYPLLTSFVQQLTGLRTDLSLLLTSNLCFFVAMCLFYVYSLERTGGDTASAQLALASIALFPTTFFFRMPYSESTMLLVSLLVLMGIRRHWPPIAVALLTGLATGTRSVGIALLGPLALYLLERPVTCRRKALDLLLYIPIGAWGLLAFACYLQQNFDEPLAFVKVQSHWQARPSLPLAEKITNLVTFSPIRDLFDSKSDHYWQRHPPWGHAPFSFAFTNPVYFLCFAALVAFGRWRGWLNHYELALATALILIPYIAHGHETSMLSTGRFVAVAFPAYLVMGKLLVRLPIALTSTMLGVCACFLGIYSALFVRWYWIV